MTNGLKKGNLIVLAGRPSMGMKRVYVFGLKSSVSEGKSDRYTFSTWMGSFSHVGDVALIFEYVRP